MEIVRNVSSDFNDGDLTILDHQIESLFSAGVRNVGIVVGYEKNQIIEHVAANYPGTSARTFFFIENPVFAKTNNIYSFWLAQRWLNEEPFICLNADVVFGPTSSSPRRKVGRAYHDDRGPCLARRNHEGHHFS